MQRQGRTSRQDSGFTINLYEQQYATEEMTMVVTSMMDAPEVESVLTYTAQVGESLHWVSVMLGDTVTAKALHEAAERLRSLGILVHKAATLALTEFGKQILSITGDARAGLAWWVMYSAGCAYPYASYLAWASQGYRLIEGKADVVLPSTTADLVRELMDIATDLHGTSAQRSKQFEARAYIKHRAQRYFREYQRHTATIQRAGRVIRVISGKRHTNFLQALGVATALAHPMRVGQISGAQCSWPNIRQGRGSAIMQVAAKKWIRNLQELSDCRLFVIDPAVDGNNKIALPVGILGFMSGSQFPIHTDDDNTTVGPLTMLPNCQLATALNGWPKFGMSGGLLEPWSGLGIDAELKGFGTASMSLPDKPYGEVVLHEIDYDETCSSSL
jgi:hypothetical protein